MQVVSQLVDMDRDALAMIYKAVDSTIMRKSICVTCQSAFLMVVAQRVEA